MSNRGKKAPASTEQATLGGGCFWCLEAVFQQVRGIEQVVSGYAGGHTDKPNYENMHYQDTGHAEVVQLTFDPSLITYREILEIFFILHDPTTLNRQAYDIGPEYRSIILYHTKTQQKAAEQAIKGFAAKHWDNPIVTELKPLDKFWPAEDWNQDFYNKNPAVGYCQVIINPKLAKLRQEFASKLKGH